MKHPTSLHRIDSASLREIYQIVDELKSEDLTTAIKRTKIGMTRMRVKLLQIGKLCTDARSELQEMRDGEIRRT